MTTRRVEVAIGVLAERLDKRWRLLITRRPEGAIRAGWWEWPGGKIEPGETPQQCLAREFMEELALRVKVGEALPIIEHHYEHAHVRLHPFFCARSEASSEPQNLMVAEHRWVTPQELASYKFLEANAPLVEHLLGVLNDAAEHKRNEHG